MGKRGELEDVAIRLYAEGMEIPKISEELNVSENSLRKWKQRAGREWDEARSVCRQGYIASFEDVGTRLRRSREIAATLGNKAGLPEQGRMGLVVNELLQSLLFDMSAKVQTSGGDPEEMAATIDQLKGLALTMQRLEQAANLNLKRESEIRRNLATAAEKQIDQIAGGGKTFSADDMRRIIRESYGV